MIMAIRLQTAHPPLGHLDVQVHFSNIYSLFSASYTHGSAVARLDEAMLVASTDTKQFVIYGKISRENTSQKTN